jgi:hypothetical protein
MPDHKYMPATQGIHIHRHGALCPFCGADSTEGGSVNIVEGCAIQGMWCNDCGAEWDDEYKLSGYSVRLAPTASEYQARASWNGQCLLELSLSAYSSAHAYSLIQSQFNIETSLAVKVASLARFFAIEMPDFTANFLVREPKFGDWLKETQDVVVDDEDDETREFFNEQAIALQALMPSQDVLFEGECNPSKAYLACHAFAKIMAQLDRRIMPLPEIDVKPLGIATDPNYALPLDAWYLNFNSSNADLEVSNLELADTLMAGVSADIWFDAADHNDASAMITIESTQTAMEVAANRLRAI